LTVSPGASFFGGYANFQNNQGGLYPPGGYPGGAGSLGWNFSSGLGEFNIWNNYTSGVAAGIHLRQRTGVSSSVLTAAFTSEDGNDVNGNAYLGKLFFAPGTYRTRQIEQCVYSGTFATGQTSQVVKSINRGGTLQLYTSNPQGNFSVATYPLNFFSQKPIYLKTIIIFFFIFSF